MLSAVGERDPRPLVSGTVIFGRTDEVGDDLLLRGWIEDAGTNRYNATVLGQGQARTQLPRARAAPRSTLAAMTSHVAPEGSRIAAGGAGLVIRQETADDHREVREVHTRAFGDGERVPGLVEALRVAEAALAPISFVATVDDRVVGHVLLSATRLDAPRRIVDVLSLSPLGVLPEFQRQGIGTQLIASALAAADSQNVPLVFLEGSPRYYGTRGFEGAGAMGFRSPSLRIPEAAFQVARLSAYEPWMTGSFVYSEVFWAFDCVGLRDPEA
ncbi:GNAT family N-acetyltransferase [Streptomyces graminofaciens]|uniref:GNAT family N-acetyltransferase n=1 Tax=Streptomyces graminofaciens TaxID=68212 RepID=UPI0033056250